MKAIEGTVYVVKDNIDTDQILPGQYITLNPSDTDDYRKLGQLAMCGLPAEYPQFVDAETGKALGTIVVAGRNFGCGSSREQAPSALGAAGVKAIIAESFARIFYRNCIATGDVLPIESDVRLIESLKTGDTVSIDVAEGKLRVSSTGKEYPINDFGELADVIEAGGLFEYAAIAGLIPDKSDT